MVPMVNNPPENAGAAGDIGSIPGLGRSPGGGHSNPLNILAWTVPWTEEPGGLQFMGSQRVGHDSAYMHSRTYLLIVSLFCYDYTV